MAEIPDTSSFYGALHTKLSREQVADLFAAHGWEVRAPDDCDHLEVICPWAELVVGSKSPILLHGPVADVTARAEEVVAPLRAAGVTFTAECYGPKPDQALLLELRS